MRSPLSFVVVIGLSLLGACGQKPRAELLDSGAVSRARTFGPMRGNPLTIQGERVPKEVGRWIADAASAELEARGYRRAENPDLVGRALVAVAEQKGQWIEASSPGALPRPVIQTQDWTEGTLIIELLDPRTSAIVWRGTAREAVSPGTGEPEVKAAISRMFADFPRAK